MTAKYLVLFNAGLKATFLAALAKREGETILCHIMDKNGRPGQQETKYRISLLAELFDLPLVTIQLERESPPLKETLLQMLYLTLQSLPTAKAHYCKWIYHGLSRDDDAAIVPMLDQFTKQLGDLLVLAQPLYDGRGGWLGSVELETPLRKLDRARVIRLGNEWNIPWELTHSCDRSFGEHCGTCSGCRRRRQAFKQEGHEDLTVYSQ